MNTFNLIGLLSSLIFTPQVLIPLKCMSRKTFSSIVLCSCLDDALRGIYTCSRNEHYKQRFPTIKEKTQV
jgi:hypothetical protein